MRTAAYARYSSDQQRDASLEDQLRNCRARCEREGWPEPVAYTDAAISGARADRPGYRALLADAHQFDVVLVDDLSRLSRDSAECSIAVKRMTFAGVRLIGVSDGVDTSRKSHKADVGLRGLMSEMYLDDLAEKTHRGLTGRVLAGASGGGLAYGYRVGAVGERIIDPAQADIVRRIYRDYLAGRSPRDIASALNAERIPSPRGGSWMASAIGVDRKRGIGILVNPIYAGRAIWNRSRWIKHPDTGRRVRQERPESEWITTDLPELAIVDRATWNAVQARITSRATPAGKSGGPGRTPRHLFSGLLRCAECAGPIVSVDSRCYGCSQHKERGAAVCSSTLRVPRSAVERALLAGLQAELLTPARCEQFQRAAAAALRRAAPDLNAYRRNLADAERTHANIVAALRAGIITPTTRAELLATERAVADARARIEVAQTYQPARILPRAREIWRSMVDRIADHARNIPAARDAIRELTGDSITLKRENGALVAEIAPSNVTLEVVAGARYELYLCEPIRIPIPLPAGRGRAL